jgi:hypothetical protein
MKCADERVATVSAFLTVGLFSCAIIPPQLSRGLALRERPTDSTALSVATPLTGPSP